MNECLCQSLSLLLDLLFSSLSPSSPLYLRPLLSPPSHLPLSPLSLLPLFLRLPPSLTLLGIWSGTPFLRNAMAVSGWPAMDAMCMSVEPSLVRADTLARNLSTRSSTIPVWPFSAAICKGLRSICAAITGKRERVRRVKATRVRTTKYLGG